MASYLTKKIYFRIRFVFKKKRIFVFLTSKGRVYPNFNSGVTQEKIMRLIQKALCSGHSESFELLRLEKEWSIYKQKIENSKKSFKVLNKQNNKTFIFKIRVLQI
jgi:hypothetical protein